MDIVELLKIEDKNKVVEALKSRRGKPEPDIAKSKSQWKVQEHATITDFVKLPNRTVEIEEGKTKTIEVNRIAFPFQKKIVNTAVSFAFGLPVILNADPQGESQIKMFNALTRNVEDNRIDSFNRKMYRELLRSSEVAELWYIKPVKELGDYYGIDQQISRKVKVSLLSPYAGDKLYPFFDEYGEMVAFSRLYKFLNNEGKEIEQFDVYTDTYIIRFKNEANSWKMEDPKRHGFSKIPVIFGSIEDFDWVDVQIAIDRIEFLFSKFAETNDYHASPTVFVKGKILSMPEKGDSGKVLEGDENGDAKYLSWDRAPESVKLEIDSLLRFIYGFTQTPDISFDSIKGISSISGVALEMLFTDAHLKVQEKKEVLDEYLSRRVSVQKHLLGGILGMEKEATSLDITPEIIPFKINDDSTLVQNLATAVGGGFMSIKTAIKILNWAKKPEEEFLQILEEVKRKNSFDLFEPTDS